MSFARLASLMRNLLHKQREERDLDEEVGSYELLLADEKIRAGLNPPEARRQARLELGGLEQVKEQVRETRAGYLFETLVQDVRFGLRTLARAPGFTTVVVLSLALGIGANTAIFTLLNSILFKMLPVKNPQELALLQWSVPLEPGFRGHWYDGSSWPEGGKEVGFSFP
jgi:hypothetical protein